MPNYFHFLIRIRSEDAVRSFRRELSPEENLQDLPNLEGFLSRRLGNFFNAYAKAFNKAAIQGFGWGCAVADLTGFANLSGLAQNGLRHHLRCKVAENHFKLRSLCRASGLPGRILPHPPKSGIHP